MATKNVQTASGNRIQIEFDGQRVGLIQSVRPNDNYGLEGAYQIGSINPVEHVPTKATHSLSVSAMVLLTGNMRQKGLIPENGTSVLLGLVYDFVYYSLDSGLVVMKYTGCSYASGDMDVSANRIVMQNAQFLALDRVGTAL